MSNKTTKKATIIKRHPHLFDIELEDGTAMKAYPAGKIRQNQISIKEGDKVRVEIPETGNKGRIIYRFN